MKELLENLKNRKVQSPLIDNIWGEYYADMKSISKFNRGFRFLLCVIDIYSKYGWVIPLKDKKGITITNAFQNILKKSYKNQTKYDLIKAVNFIIAQWNRG